ncbi:MAG: hypothetical protein ACOC7T_00805 [Planctomycetota bacterium]
MHTKIKRLLLLVVAVALLMGGAGSALRPLRRMRKRYNLTNEPEKGLSPEIALATQALGWGRGIIIDVIWIRMESLKRQGRFFELVQLADWACTLAPRIPEVWDIQSWNMAYNVSPKIDRLPDRWQWVWNGVKLLRDEGLHYNPESPQIYEKLAFMIWHKIGGQDDYAHPFYKARFARIMHELLGGSGDAKTLQGLAEAPRTRRELMQDEGVSRLASRSSELGCDIVGQYFAYLRETGAVPQEVRTLLQKEENHEARRKIGLFARARRLRREFKMEPGLMLAMREHYADKEGNPAPFDWRSPYPHALYWARRGLEAVEGQEQKLEQTVEDFGLEQPVVRRKIGDEVYEEGLYANQRVQLKRIVYGTMQSLVRHGRILYGPNGEMLLDAGTDYRFADATLPLYEEMLENSPERYRNGVRRAYEGFLRRGVIEFYFMGDAEKSRRYFARLEDKFASRIPEDHASYEGYLEWALSDYVSAMTYSQARTLVRGYLTQAYVSLAANADDKAAALEKEAKMIAENWTDVEQDSLRENIRFERIKQSVLTGLLTARAGSIPSQLMENLKERVGTQKVEKILSSVEEGRKKTPRTEQLPSKYLVDPNVKPYEEPYLREEQ